MRACLSCALGLLLLVPTAPSSAQEPLGISSPELSRCAGRAGLDARESDAAFGIIMLDGAPWMTVEETDEQVGGQQAAHAVVSTGLVRRRNGAMVPIRFTCMLDDKGQALMFYGRKLLPDGRDPLQPARLLHGAAVGTGKQPLPRGSELQVQLRDRVGSQVMAEQVVRSGWAVPIPFVLRLAGDARLAGRTLTLTARLVIARQTVLELKKPLAISGDALGRDDLRLPDELVLEQVAAGR